MNIENIEKTKSIFVLLTAQSDPFSRLIRLFTWGRYTHASIGIDEHLNHFFSFVTKSGFYLERPTKSKKAKKMARQCALYRLDVTEEIYEKIKDMIERFQLHEKQYRYSYIGVLLCILRIPHRSKNSYFCSQFVSELLISSGAAQLKKKPSVYLPDDFIREPMLRFLFKGSLGELAGTF